MEHIEIPKEVLEEHQGEWIYGIWFVGSKDRDKDWMCTVSRRKDGKVHIVYRFRYYNEESKTPHDGKDKKNFYHFAADGVNDDTEMKKAVEATHMMSQLISLRHGGPSVSQ